MLQQVVLLSLALTICLSTIFAQGEHEQSGSEKLSENILFAVRREYLKDHTHAVKHIDKKDLYLSFEPVEVSQNFGAKAVFDISVSQRDERTGKLRLLNLPIKRYAYFGPKEVAYIATNPLNSPLKTPIKPMLDLAYESRTGLHEWPVDRSDASIAYKSINKDAKGELLEVVLVERQRSPDNRRTRYVGPIQRFVVSALTGELQDYVPPPLNHAYVVFARPESLTDYKLDGSAVFMAEVSDAAVLKSLREFMDFREPGRRDFEPFARHPIVVVGTFKRKNDGNNVPWHQWTLQHLNVVGEDREAQEGRPASGDIFETLPRSGHNVAIENLVPIAMLDSFGELIAGNYPVGRQINIGEPDADRADRLTPQQRFFWQPFLTPALYAQRFATELRLAKMPAKKNSVSLQLQVPEQRRKDTVNVAMGSAKVESMFAETPVLNSDYHQLEFMGETQDGTMFALELKFLDLNFLYDGKPLYFTNRKKAGLTENLVVVSLQVGDKGEMVAADHGMLRIKKINVDDNNKVYGIVADLVFAMMPHGSQDASKGVMRLNVPRGCADIF